MSHVRRRLRLPALAIAGLLIQAILIQWMTAGPVFPQIQRVTITPQIAKLRPLTKDQELVLGNVRAWSESYMRSLPDYMCIQTTKRNAQPAGLNAWPVSDIVRQSVTWSGHRETYEILSVNGKPFDKEVSTLGGNFSTGEFGTFLDRLFSPESGTEFGYERRTTLRGVAVDVFAYQVSNSHGYTLYSGLQKYESAWEGLIYADHTTGAVLRIRMECIGIPSNFPVHRLSMTLDYGPAKIGNREFILPAHFELTQESSGGVTQNHADYGSYRKFQTEASFTPDAVIPDSGR
jgi:hypothetical protein